MISPIYQPWTPVNAKGEPRESNYSNASCFDTDTDASASVARSLQDMSIGSAPNGSMGSYMQRRFAEHSDALKNVFQRDPPP